MSIAIGDRLSMMMEMMIPQVCFAGLQSVVSGGRKWTTENLWTETDTDRQRTDKQTD